MGAERIEMSEVLNYLGTAIMCEVIYHGSITKVLLRDMRANFL